MKKHEEILIIKNTFSGLAFLCGLVLVKKKVDQILMVGGVGNDNTTLNSWLKTKGYPKIKNINSNPLEIFEVFLKSSFLEVSEKKKQRAGLMNSDSLILELSPGSVRIQNYQRLWNWTTKELGALYRLSDYSSFASYSQIKFNDNSFAS